MRTRHGRTLQFKPHPIFQPSAEGILLFTVVLEASLSRIIKKIVAVLLCRGDSQTLSEAVAVLPEFFVSNHGRERHRSLPPRIPLANSVAENILR